LKSSPDDALTLLDYAQFQAAIGRLERAERAIRTAVTLRPNNRTVLRTAARFFVHAGKPDVGHALIRRHARTASDPWLMATEIALADVSQVQSMFLGKGRRFLIDHKSLPASQLTELAGALSMAEFNSGNLKRAREMQRQALLAPNDNVIAQAVEYRSRLGLQLEGPTIERAMAGSNEAQVLQAW
jgi:tetratricopeptide (TPR) repeat protein